jgi:hypothetical protein
MAEQDDSGNLFLGEKGEKIRHALNAAFDLTRCIQALVDDYGNADRSGTIFVACDHLARLACRHLDVVLGELFDEPGRGDFEDEFRVLGASYPASPEA